MSKTAWALALGMLATLAYAGDMGPENAKAIRERALSSTASEQAAANTGTVIGSPYGNQQPAMQNPGMQQQQQNPDMTQQPAPNEAAPQQ
jgi:hypothetical protein